MFALILLGIPFLAILHLRERWKTSNRGLSTLLSPCRTKASQKLRLGQMWFSSVPDGH